MVFFFFSLIFYDRLLSVLTAREINFNLLGGTRDYAANHREMGRYS